MKPWLRKNLNLSSRKVLMLRNHGPVVIGGNLAQAFSLMWLVNRACEIQIAAAPLGKQRQIPADILKKCVRDSLNFNPKFGAGEDALMAMIRLVERDDPSFRY